MGDMFGDDDDMFGDDEELNDDLENGLCCRKSL
jgi:hypothetical protein